MSCPLNRGLMRHFPTPCYEKLQLTISICDASIKETGHFPPGQHSVYVFMENIVCSFLLSISGVRRKNSEVGLRLRNSLCFNLGGCMGKIQQVIRAVKVQQKKYSLPAPPFWFLYLLNHYIPPSFRDVFLHVLRVSDFFLLCLLKGHNKEPRMSQLFKNLLW